jgi:hypothetical protein
MANGREDLRFSHAPAALCRDFRRSESDPCPGAATGRYAGRTLRRGGNREFNMFLWMPPAGKRAGDILLADSTIFTTLFGGDESLARFWKNLASK